MRETGERRGYIQRSVHTSVGSYTAQESLSHTVKIDSTADFTDKKYFAIIYL